MTELDPAARLVVQLARRGDSPERSDRDRVRAGLAALLAAPEAPGGVPVPRAPADAAPSAPAAPLRRGIAPLRPPAWLWVAVLTLSSAAAAATSAAVVVTHWRPVAPAAAPTVVFVPTVASTQAESPRLGGNGRASTPESKPTSASVAAAEVAPNLLASVTVAAERARRPAVGAAPPPPKPTLTEETALLRAARDALAAADLNGAARALAEHEARMPHGELAEDREALQAVLACRRGAAAGAAEAFLGRFPATTLAPRVLSECRTERR
jgi:hypothetical protein